MVDHGIISRGGDLYYGSKLVLWDLNDHVFHENMLLLSFVSFAQPDSHTPMLSLLSMLASPSASLPNCNVICTVIVIPDEENQHPTYSTVSYQADIHKPRNGMIPLAVNANDTLAKV